MSYRIVGHLGQGAPEVRSPDTAPFEDPFAPLTTSRGFVKVPTYDVRQYVQTTLIVLAVGFGAGVGIGAIFGNILGKGKASSGIGKVFRNPKRRRRSSRKSRRRSSRKPRRNTKRTTKGTRRTTARRRKRGRPTVKLVGSYDDWVKMDDGHRHVVIHSGKVHVGPARTKPTRDDPQFSRSPIGTIYDAGTRFRSVPNDWDAPVREYTTLAGAIKHLILQQRAA